MQTAPEAAAAFVARLASVGVFVSRPELLADGLAGFLAAERAAVREACAAHVLPLRRPLKPDWWDRYIADAIRALPLE